MYTRFDGMVAPLSTITQMSNIAKKYFILGSSSEVKYLSFAKAQEVSLHAFLQEHSNLLKSLDSPLSNKVSNLESFVNAVFKIYEQLRIRQMCIKGEKEDWVATSLAKVRM